MLRRSMLVRVCSVALVMAVAIGMSATAALAADANGNWKWTQKLGKDDGKEVEMMLKLKVDGEKLTGTIGGAGGKRQTEISDGTFKNDELSFTVSREGKKGKQVTKYTGKVDGDTIRGKATSDGGKARERDWEAKRSS